MSGFTQKPPQLKQTTSRKGTGFPEPLSKDRNTTLPHSKADTSEDACIEAHDIVVNHTQHRHHILPFQHHPKNSDQGEMPSGLYDSIIAAKSSNEDKRSRGLAQEVEGEQNISSAPTEQRNEGGHKERTEEAH
ncbi:hypothetical protein B7463_g11277, partial [Scytalidium lignicola]